MNQCKLRLIAQWDSDDFHDSPQRVKHRRYNQPQTHYKIDVIEDTLQDGGSEICFI